MVGNVIPRARDPTSYRGQQPPRITLHAATTGMAGHFIPQLVILRLTGNNHPPWVPYRQRPPARRITLPPPPPSRDRTSSGVQLPVCKTIPAIAIW